MKKKLLVLVCMVVLVFSSVNVYASEMGVTPRYVPCWRCSNGMVLTRERVVYAEIVAVGGCSHGKSGIDMIMQRWYEEQEYCSNCGDLSNWTSIGSRMEYECHGE